MSTKIKALFCLFLVGILVGACGRKFRAIDESDAIESRAILLAKQHFDTLFDTQQEYQDHVQLKSELMALQMISDNTQGVLSLNVAENDCVTVDVAGIQYTDQAIFQSVTPGQSIPFSGQNGYAFNAVCIPTAIGGQQQCAHFLIAIQKTYDTGRKGSAYAVVGYDQSGQKWSNLEMSANFLYAVNLRTLDDVESSFSCSQNSTNSTSGSTSNSNSSVWDGIKVSAGNAIIGWAVEQAQGRWDKWWGSITGADSTTPSETTTPTPTPTLPSTSTSNTPSSNQSDTFPSMGNDTFETPTTSEELWDFDEAVDPFPLEDANDDQSEYCFESGAC